MVLVIGRYLQHFQDFFILDKTSKDVFKGPLDLTVSQHIKGQSPHCCVCRVVGPL